MSRHERSAYAGRLEDSPGADLKPLVRRWLMFLFLPWVVARRGERTITSQRVRLTVLETQLKAANEARAAAWRSQQRTDERLGLDLEERWRQLPDAQLHVQGVFEGYFEGDVPSKRFTFGFSGTEKR